MMNMACYLALQDELWRFNLAIRNGSYPTIYRNNKTYLIEWAFLESDLLWFDVYELVWTKIQVHRYEPSYLVHDTFPCLDEAEWVHLLTESGLTRHVYFAGPSTHLTFPLPIVYTPPEA